MKLWRTVRENVHFHFVRAAQRLRFSDLVNGGLFLQARWADQSESAKTMTTQAVIVGRGGGLLTWHGRL